MLAVMAQYITPGVQKVTEKIPLSELTQNYNDGLYSEILIDANKAIATLS